MTSGLPPASRKPGPNVHTVPPDLSHLGQEARLLPPSGFLSQRHPSLSCVLAFEILDQYSTEIKPHAAGENQAGRVLNGHTDTALKMECRLGSARPACASPQFAWTCRCCSKPTACVG
ncbi:hypothetical protein AAFF_G00036210 [Aldrovandia affinis]|uniref:Uncharacterized protein n=1 Tax=Aldrovandia affinis TaxID=143900 RepID=A0AAD7S3D8_9TELE|nr:hypothetical protein AAFF_G00036210 [Aldrovandia affinis]